MNFSDFRSKIKDKKTSVKELTIDFLKKIETYNPKLNAYITETKTLALKQADNIDKKIENNEPLPQLAGLPIAIKDNLCTKGILTSCSSNMLKNFISPYESTTTKSLWDSGAVCLGKTNLDEFAMGSSTETSAFGVTSNPWDINRVPGGSSGGSAASVAAGLCLASLGSDTGGSIRQPASFCGIVGLKPTYGRCSRWGIVAFASSLDQAGPMTRNVEDAALLLYNMVGYDPKDSTSVNKEVPNFKDSIRRNIKKSISAAEKVGGLYNNQILNRVASINFRRYASLNIQMKESFNDLQTFMIGKSFAGQNLFWRERGEFWFTNASMDFFDFFFKFFLNIFWKTCWFTQRC